jgi:hypothetical protein
MALLFFEERAAMLSPLHLEIENLRTEIEQLRSAAEALAKRTLKYVGPVRQPEGLECDVEMRKLAKAVLKLL